MARSSHSSRKTSRSGPRPAQTIVSSYILGAIFGASDRVGAEIMGITRANFRQILTRARRELHSFMDGQCGLVNEANSFRSLG